MISEAIGCHHADPDHSPTDNPYWRALKQADVADIEAWDKLQIRQAVADTAAQVGVSVNAVQAEVEKAKEEITEEALQQLLIQAIRSLVLEKLPCYENSHFVAKQKGWILLVAPIYVADKGGAKPGIVPELSKLAGRRFDETAVIKTLLEMGLAVQVGNDESRTYPQLVVESGGIVIDRLRFLPLQASRIFTAEEIATLPSCRIRNLDEFADPDFANAEIAEFYAECVKGKLRGEYLQVPTKALEIYDAEPETPSVLEDGLQQEERDLPLWKHALEIARISSSDAETGDYPMLVVGSLTHDIGKAEAAALTRKTMACNHAVAGMATVGKMLTKKSPVRDAIMALVKGRRD